jgi:chromosome partitioning protein
MTDANGNDCLFIVPYMPKGGVGKTTTAAHLSYALSEYGKTLVIDTDPQGNLTNHLLDRSSFEDINKNLLEYFLKNLSFEDCLIEARPHNDTFKGLYLIGTPNNSQGLQDYIQSKFPTNPGQLKYLKKIAIANNFKFVIFDPPAALSLYTRYIITLATHVIPIIEPESFGFEAFIDLYHELEDIKEQFDVTFNNQMAVINKNDPKNGTHKHFLNKIKDSPFKPLFVINDTKNIPSCCARHILLQEFKPDNINNTVFSDIAKYFNNVLIKKQN